MTQASIQDKRYCIPPAKTLKVYDEKYPESLGIPYFRPRIPSCPDVGPFLLKSNILTMLDRSTENLNNNKINQLSPNYKTEDYQRRHSWSPGTETDNDEHQFELKGSLILFQRRYSGDSRRSSIASVPEVIEECSSSEEINQEPTQKTDYMHCVNCSRTSSTDSLESSETHNIQYCYNCKHLYQTKNTFAATSKDVRRSSWGGEISRVPSPRRSRRSSLTDSTDLPIITEPFVDEDIEGITSTQISIKQRSSGLLAPTS